MNYVHEYFEQGYLARLNNLPITACPLLFKAWPYNAWRLGWQYSDLKINVRDGNVEEHDLERVEKTPFEQGGIAHKNGVAYADCPYGPGEDRVQWLAGWLAELPPPEDKPAEEPTSRLRYVILAVILMWAFIMWLVFG